MEACRSGVRTLKLVSGEKNSHVCRDGVEPAAPDDVHTLLSSLAAVVQLHALQKLSTHKQTSCGFPFPKTKQNLNRYHTFSNKTAHIDIYIVNHLNFYPDILKKNVIKWIKLNCQIQLCSGEMCCSQTTVWKQEYKVPMWPSSFPLIRRSMNLSTSSIKPSYKPSQRLNARTSAGQHSKRPPPDQHSTHDS